MKDETLTAKLLYANITKKMTMAKVHSKIMQKATRAIRISINVGTILNNMSWDQTQISFTVDYGIWADLECVIDCSPTIQNT